MFQRRKKIVTLFTDKAESQCLKCKRQNVKNINIEDNCLYRICEDCNQRQAIGLPKIEKKILYLDLSFYIQSTKQNQINYISAYKRIDSMARDQLLICPYSEIHELETEFWSNDKILSKIKKTANEIYFKERSTIISYQTYLALQKFKNQEPCKFELSRYFCEEINSWANYYPLRVPSFKLEEEKIKELKKAKEAEVENYLRLFVEWRNKKTTFQEDYEEEILNYRNQQLFFYAQKLLAYLQLFEGNSIDFNKFLHIGIIDSILFQDNDIGLLDKFLPSPQFKNLPFVNIRAYLLAKLRQKVKKEKNWLNNEKKAFKSLRGLYFDIEYLSIFGPFCHAIFTDNQMAEWMDDYLESKYNVLEDSLVIFSAKNWNKFDLFLNEIENNKKIIQPFLDIIDYSE